MKATKIELRCDMAVVVITPTQESSDHGAVIEIHGIDRNSLADGIVRMVNESQCSVCGKFNGLHGEIYIKTGQDGFGGVEGHFDMCPNNGTR